MKVLILSYYFAPYNTIAAHRLSSLSRHLMSQGHDVRVVTADHASLPKGLEVDLAADRVLRTGVVDMDFLSRGAAFLRSLIGRRRGAIGNSGPAGMGSIAKPDADQRGCGVSLRRRIDELYQNLLFWPDVNVGWLFHALPATTGLCRRWRPDLIYATTPPATTLVLGWIVSRRSSIPWVAEIRDRWANDPYDPRPPWRAALDRRLERRVLSSARAIVTVSETWARTYRVRYGKPTAVIYNGFLPEDYERQPSETPPDARDSLRIVYTGAVYAGRDPTPLWRALALLGPASDGIRVEFYGSPGAAILAGAARHGVSENVRVRDSLPHGEAVRLQCQADVLLLLQWNISSEAGNIPGKLFEYLGARRPILALGYDGGEMARIVQERKAGLLANDPEEIARQLEAWCAEKRETGHITPPPKTAHAGFSREEQFARLEGFLQSAVSSKEGLVKGDGGWR